MCYRRGHENQIRSLARRINAVFVRADSRLLNAYRNRDRHTFADLAPYINTNRDTLSDSDSDSDSETNG